MDIKSLLDLYAHMAWADAKVWAALLDCERAREDAKLRETLYHLHVAQRVFLRAWRGEPLDTPHPTFERASALCGWAGTYYGEVKAYLKTLTDAASRGTRPDAWAQRLEKVLGGDGAGVTLGDTLAQVALHSQYHRGQVNARLRELGGTPPLVDYIAWAWFGRPEAAWPTVNGGDTPQ
ncbi:MAG: DinB family protein [Candidatus Hydrogenedentes bacterium]|nr:DinB family protein [Candidatus Hydrogenedentota bacterium]